MVKKLILPRNVWQAMRRHVSRRAPFEACGLLAGDRDRVVRTLGVPNVEKSLVRFHMEPRAQWRAFQGIEAAGLEVVGIYHSHPNGPDHLSPTDIAENMYPVPQIIWFRVDDKWQVRGFQIEKGEVSEIALEFPRHE